MRWHLSNYCVLNKCSSILYLKKNTLKLGAIAKHESGKSNCTLRFLLLVRCKYILLCKDKMCHKLCVMYHFKTYALILHKGNKHLLL